MELHVIMSAMLAMAVSSLASTCPSSIKVEVPGYSYNGKTGMHALHAQLLSCPDIRSLDLRVSLQGCSGWPDRWSFPFIPAGGETYPTLTSLTLEGYRFNYTEWEDNENRHQTIFARFAEYISLLWSNAPAKQRRLTNLELWLEAMDWSALESLELRKGVEDCFVDMATSHLTGLKHLTLEESWHTGNTTIPRLLTSLPALVQLQSLAWLGGEKYNDLDAVIDRHCGSLERLDLHTKVPFGSDALSKKQIQMVAERCPELKHISLVIDRNGSWPLEDIVMLARIPKLASADIWLELTSDCTRNAGKWDKNDCGGKDAEYRKPLLDTAAAKELFSYVLQQRALRDLPPILNMSFYIGDWSRPWDRPLYEPSWWEGKGHRYDCYAMVEGKLGDGVFDCKLTSSVDSGLDALHTVVDHYHQGDEYYDEEDGLPMVHLEL